MINDYDQLNEEINQNNSSQSKNGMFFMDGIRKIDFVLVYQRVSDNQINQTKRKRFIDFMNDEGLETEIESENGKFYSTDDLGNIDDDSNVVFIKIHGQWETICNYAKILKIRKPILETNSHLHINQKSVFKNLFEKVDYFNIFNIKQFQPIHRGYTMPYSLSKNHLFNIPENKLQFFTPAERSLIVNYILRWINSSSISKSLSKESKIPSNLYKKSNLENIEMNTISDLPEKTENNYNNTENDLNQSEEKLLSNKYDDLNKINLANLINDGVFENAYSLHEELLLNEDTNPSVENNNRTLLYKHWASIKNIFRLQPLSQIRYYYGEKVAFYFAWLGYYTYWLLFPSVLGLIVTIYSVFKVPTDLLVNEIYEGKNITMCPFLCNPRECRFWKLSELYYRYFVIRILDNETTVLMAFGMSIWASLFLEMWKRQQNQLAYQWNVHDLANQNEPLRPEYLAIVNKIPPAKKSKVFIPFLRRRIPLIFITYSTVIFSIILALAFLVGIILYEIVIYSILMMNPNSIVTKLSNLIISVTGTIISLVVILSLTMFYAKVATWLTDMEHHKTQSEYDDSVTTKLYLLEFINNYSYLFYFGFILPYIQPIPMNRLSFTMKPIGCPTGGCLLGLSTQLAFIMIGRQAFSHLSEFGFPRLCSSIKRCQLRKSKETLKNKVSAKSKIRVDNQNENKSIPPELIRCYEDYILADLESQPVFYEYLEMLIQFGFITMFIPALPLAPLFAFINNLLEIRGDASKFITSFKRPIAQRVKSIGIWLKILSILAEIALKSNAILIAFTTSFIERLIYVSRYSKTGNLEGYIDFSLSYLNGSEFYSSNYTSNETYCRYMDFRYPPWERNYQPISFTPIYWEILAAKVVFVYLFETSVYLLMRIISAAIPDIPEKLCRMRKSEVKVTNEILLRDSLSKGNIQNIKKEK